MKIIFYFFCSHHRLYTTYLFQYVISDMNFVDFLKCLISFFPCKTKTDITFLYFCPVRDLQRSHSPITFFVRLVLSKVLPLTNDVITLPISMIANKIYHNVKQLHKHIKQPRIHISTYLALLCNITACGDFFRVCRHEPSM